MKEQEDLLAQDESLRRRGTRIGAVEQATAITVRAWDGTPTVESQAFARSTVPSAGFSILEADSIDEVIGMVSRTPCARARGAIEIHPILIFNDVAAAA